MMKYHFFFVVLLLTATVCQAQNQIDSQGRRQGHWIKTDKQGATIYEGNFVDGQEIDTFTYFYPDGTVRIRNHYTVPGKICNHEVFDPKGHLLAKGVFNQKNRDGLWEFFSTNGNRIKITTYRMGVRDGLQVIFTSNGDTAEVCTWSDNHRHGRWWKRIGLKGHITATFVHGGIEGRLVEYDDNQLLVREGHYSGGERHGIWSYYDQGQKVMTESWKMGILRDRQVRLLLPEERYVSIFDINYMAPLGKNKTLIYLSDGTRLTHLDSSEKLYARIGSERFTLANKDARIMIATELIVGTTHDSEGREILSLDPRPDFDVFPDEDCMKMLHSLQLQQQTHEAGGIFDFDR